MRKRRAIVGTFVASGMTFAALVGGAQVSSAAGPTLASASGSGKLSQDRTFTFNAKKDADGTVTGHATLVNKSFSGENGHSPYQLQLDISCMNVVGNIAIFGGTT